MVTEQNLPMTKPEDVGLSTERLHRIRGVWQWYIDGKLVPGVVSLIARDGKVAYLDAMGFRNAEAGTLLTTDSIFRIASMTKPIQNPLIRLSWTAVT